MLHENVKKHYEKDGKCYITTENGLFVLIESDREKELFYKSFEKENSSDLIKTEEDRLFLQRMVNLKILNFEDMEEDESVGREYDKRLVHYNKEEPLYPAPVMAHVAIENNCNLRCEYCSVRNTHKQIYEKMNVEQLKKVIKDLDEWGAGQITLTGGEPLLRLNDVIELLEYGKNIGTPISLSTNGWLMTEEIAERLKKAGLKLCQISLDSPDEEINDSLRGKGNFQRAVNALKIGVSKELVMGVDCVVTKRNIKTLPKLIDFLDELGVNFLTFLKLKPGDLTDEKYEELMPDPLEYSDFLRYVAKVQEQKNIKITVDCGSISNLVYIFNEKELEEVPILGCPLGHAQIVINPNGDIYPCAALLDEKFKLGNILKDDIKQIWCESEKLKKMRKLKDNLSETCNQCPYLNLCRGGCRGIAYRLTKSFSGEDTSCPIIYKKQEQ